MMTLPPRPVVGYGRKSTEEEDRQVMSLDRQKDEVYKAAARQNRVVSEWFSDAYSGKNFDRDGYKKLIRFCSLHKQPTDAPGTVLCYEYDRFARSVDRNFKVNMYEYHRAVLELHDLGWELDYVLTPRSGEMLADVLMGSIKPIMAGEYLTKLSTTSRAGKRRVGQEGFWLGGPPPWPAARYDTRIGVQLLRHQRSSNAACILVPESDAQVRLWEECARMFLTGASYYDVIRFLRTHGIYSFRQRDAGASAPGRVSPDTLFEAMTNTVLVGRADYHFSTKDGEFDTVETKLKWGPIVDEELFWKVKQYLDTRRKGNQRTRSHGTTFVTGYCTECGVSYRFNNVKGYRYLVHPTQLSVGKKEQDAMVLASCQNWTVPATTVEEFVISTILSHRASPEFYESVQHILSMQDEIQSVVDGDSARVQQTVTTLEKQVRNLQSSLQFADSPEEQEMVFGQIRSIKTELAEAAAQLDQHRRRAVQTKSLAAEMLEQFEETHTLAHLCTLDGEAGEQARQRLFFIWIHRLYIEVQSEGKGRKNSKKFIHLFLRTMPDSPVTSELQTFFRKAGEPTYSRGLEEMFRLEHLIVSIENYLRVGQKPVIVSRQYVSVSASDSCITHNTPLATVSV
jgi:DNA invertase Pin-like site-specific DNA recombinase